MVDATYIYINPTISVRYNPELTSLSAAALNDKLQTALISYETDNLGTFGNKFYLYEMTEKLKDADNSFISVDADILIEKRFVPLTTEIDKLVSLTLEVPVSTVNFYLSNSFLSSCL